MQLGQILEVHLRGDEPRRNIPLTAQEQGHEVLGMTDLPNGHSVLWLRRGPA
jgi:TusA-related sulfurtransferase